MSLPWQQGSAPQHCAWFHWIGHPRKPPGRCKHLRSACHTSDNTKRHSRQTTDRRHAVTKARPYRVGLRSAKNRPVFIDVMPGILQALFPDTVYNGMFSDFVRRPKRVKNLFGSILLQRYSASNQSTRVAGGYPFRLADGSTGLVRSSFIFRASPNGWRKPPRLRLRSDFANG